MKVRDLLKTRGASVRLYNVMNPRFGAYSLEFFQRQWPEERLCREIPGYGALVSLEWNAILARKGRAKK